MLKLKRYLKPYVALFLGAIILLFGQALLELTLPNYMSDIVNVGLQQGGITYSEPEAIDAQSMQLMQLFMSEEDRATVEGRLRRAFRRGTAHRTAKDLPQIAVGRLHPHRRARRRNRRSLLPRLLCAGAGDGGDCRTVGAVHRGDFYRDGFRILL